MPSSENRPSSFVVQPFAGLPDCPYAVYAAPPAPTNLLAIVAGQALAETFVAVLENQAPTATDPWPPEYAAAANAEGWDLFDNGTVLEIERVDEPEDRDAPVFADDFAAIVHVLAKSKTGSIVHREAIRQHLTPSRAAPSRSPEPTPDADGKIIVRMIVAGLDDDGPDLFFVKIRCTPADRDEGVCYDAAKSWADGEGYGGPFVAFDESDAAGRAMLSLFVWDGASVITVGEPDAPEPVPSPP